MSRSLVALVRCNSYDREAVYGALRRGIALLGGLDRFVRPGERILLKPNILAGEAPQKAVTTHPAVLEGCARLLREGEATVVFGDSPGIEAPDHAARLAGLIKAGEGAGARFVDFGAGRAVGRATPDGSLVASIPVAPVIETCDGIVNLPKMKTHQLTRVTGAIKNLYGCVPGKRKAMYHVRYPDIDAFSRLLVDLSLTLRPRLHVLDGIVAMDGNGPRSGDPIPMNVLVMSADPVAVDATFSRLVALDPAFVPTTVLGQEMGLGRYWADNIDYVGDSLADLVRPEFRLVRKPVLANASYAHFPWIKNLVLARPAINAARCTHCGLCVQACPVPDKALRFNGDGRDAPPVYDYDRCIRCYCCHEMCPNRAIEKRTPLLGRALRLEA